MSAVFKKINVHIVAVLIFFILSVMYFPVVFQGKQLAQHDMQTYQGMSQEIRDYAKKTGEHSFWTNSMFGGMPTYLIQNYNPDNLVRIIDRALKFYYKIRPVNFLFMYFLGFYIALLIFGVDPWISIVGAVGFGLSSYFLIIIQAGHITKVINIGYMAPIIAGTYAAYNGKRLLGTIIMSLFLSLQLFNNHLQVTYYTLLTILPLIIIIFIDDIKKKRFNDFIKTSAFLLLGLILAVGSNFGNIYTTYEYSKYSIRGKSELNINKENQTTGLDKDYATAWSYGKLETFNLLIPDLVGGASGSELSKNSAVYNKLLHVGASKSQASQAIKYMPTYWGQQPFTSGPVYIGALVIFLFVMGIFLVKEPLRTWLLIATILSIALAWGKNFMALTDFFFEYVPLYNKFRTVSMTLVIAEFAMPLLGIMGLNNIIQGKVSKEEVIKALKYSTGIVGGIIFIFLVNPGLLSFSSDSDAQLPEYMVDAIREDRASMMRSDAIRSLIFVLIGAGSIWYYIKGKLNKNYLLLIIGVAMLVDLWGVDKRYLNNDNFVSKRKARVPFTATQADKAILKDKSLDYRVLNIAVSTFNDASTSYFHKSVGGYHGAKMRRYQELIDHEISKEIQKLISTLKQNATQESVDNALQGLYVLNMLNTKYIIYNPKVVPLLNSHALGNAWFVDEVKTVDNASEEIKAVQNFDPLKIAIVDKRFEKQLFNFSKDSTATIQLVYYAPNKLIYKTKAGSDQLAVFSEIYYDKGWLADIDGKPAEHFRADYVLRAMKVPAGEHTITFVFKPRSWEIGSMVSLISSILLLLAIVLALWFEFKKKRTRKD